MIVAPRCKGKKWSAVQASFDKQGLSVVATGQTEDLIWTDYLFKKGLYLTSLGQANDLHLRFEAGKPGQKFLPARVWNAKAALLAQFNAPYEKIVAKRLYPPATVLDYVVGSAEINARCSDYPILKRIWVSYGPIRDKNAEHLESGFDLDMEFSGSSLGRITEKGISLSVPSGLDPPQSWDGKVKLLQGFKSQDNLGKITVWGSNEGSGS
jgi:hypothetical protein